MRGQLEAALADDCPLVGPRRRLHPRRLSRASSTRCASWPPAASSGSPAYQAERVPARTGIPSLKVGFNKVFGYYLEITNAHRDKIPADYIRKQTRQERRALHHAGAEGVRREGAHGRRAGEGAGVRAVRRAARRSWPPRRRACRRPPRRWPQLDVLAALAELARAARLLPADDRRRAGAATSSTAGIRCSTSLSRRGRSCPTT